MGREELFAWARRTLDVREAGGMPDQRGPGGSSGASSWGHGSLTKPRSPR